MNLGIENVLTNINVSFETVILLIHLFGSLIFFARNFLIGVMLLFFGSAGIFIWFFNVGFNFVPILVIFFISLVMLTLALYSVGRQSLEGGVI